MEIYIVKILDIGEEKIDNICFFIDKEKKHKIEKFINKKDKMRALTGEILIRSIIGRKLNIKNDYIMFEKNKYGKPYLKVYPNFKFNISHSGELVACVIDQDDVGIDVEKVKCIEYESISKKFFSLNEFNYIVKGDFNTQLSRFYEIWTLKESYVKYCGQGLSISLKSFSVDIQGDGSIGLTANGKCSQNLFRRFHIKPNYKMAVCSQCIQYLDKMITLNQNSLVENYLKFVLGR